MSQLKCLKLPTMIILSGAVLLVSLVTRAKAAPPSLVDDHLPVLRRVLRSPAANHAHRFQAEVISNPNVNYLKTDPIDLHINMGDEARFTMFLTKPLESDIVVEFSCAGIKCNTFDNATLEPIKMTPKEDRVVVNLTVTKAGHDIIDIEINPLGQQSNFSNEFSFVRLRVGHSLFLTVLGSVFGWVYFLAWSISFWPQNISNYRRKSVVGLNFDYTILHFTGFLFYSIFNLSLYFSQTVQREYEDQFPRSEIPVELNDVVYSIHAAAVTSITWCQCLVYEAGDQRLSIYGKIFQALSWSIGAVLMVLAIVQVVTWLNFIYYFSYVKLLITGVKYMPQVIFNFRRKSTAGWSIYMIYLDITGGTMSMLQMLTIAYNYNDWSTLVGNLPKLGLSVASILYDIVFLLQHFVFYPESHSPKATKSASGAGNLSRRSTLKEAGDGSQDELCDMNSSISSLPSTHSSATSRSDTAPGFTAAQRPPGQPAGGLLRLDVTGVSGQFAGEDATTGGGGGEEGKAAKGTADKGTVADLSHQLDAILLRRKASK